MTATLGNRATKPGYGELDLVDPKGIARAVTSVQLLISRAPADIREQLREGLRAGLGWQSGYPPRRGQEVLVTLGLDRLDWVAGTAEHEEAFEADLERWTRLVAEALAKFDSTRLRDLIDEGALLRTRHGIGIVLDAVTTAATGTVTEVPTAAAGGEPDEVARRLRHDRWLRHLDRLMELVKVRLAALATWKALTAAVVEDRRPISITPPRRHRPSAGPSAHGPPRPAPGVSTGSSMFRASATRPRFGGTAPPRT